MLNLKYWAGEILYVFFGAVTWGVMNEIAQTFFYICGGLAALIGVYWKHKYRKPKDEDNTQ